MHLTLTNDQKYICHFFLFQFQLKIETKLNETMTKAKNTFKLQKKNCKQKFIIMKGR